MTFRAQASAHEVVRSQAWDGARAEATVVVATCDRMPWLAGLLAALEAQDKAVVEVVLVDDASTDGTAEVVRDLATATSLPLLVLRNERRSGPSAARNAAAARARTSVLLMTDDDCLPTERWARAMVDAVASGATVVQGQTLPVDGTHGPWDRSITVAAPSGLFETCNLALDASAFTAAGGFADLGLLPAAGSRGFGEDAELGARLAERGRAGWCPEGLVRHRWVTGSYADHLAGRRRLAGFPALAALSPEVDRRLLAGAVLSRRTLATDVGLVGLAAAVLTTSVVPLVAVIPWGARLLAESAHRPGRSRWVRAGQLAAADVVGAGALARGSLRAKKVVL